MIIIRGKAADAVREARCTNCWPESMNEGILFIPETLSLRLEDEDEETTDPFMDELIRIFKKPVTNE